MQSFIILGFILTIAFEFSIGAPAPAPAPQQNLQYRPQQQSTNRAQTQRPPQQSSFAQPAVRQPPPRQQQQQYAPQQSARVDYIPIIRFENEHNRDGSYRFNYETGNGILHEESGYLANPGTDNEIQTVQGYYQYPDPQGNVIKTTYKVDQNGFQPEGEHLPTPPPIPPAIQKALAIIYANAAKQQKQATSSGNRYN